MKKTIQFIAMITLAAFLTSCNNTVAYPAPATAAPEVTPIATLAPTPAPTATPDPTPEPTREPSGTSFDFAKKYCDIYGDEYTEEFAAYFNHAMWTIPSDYTNIRADLPRYLYEHPYNMCAQPTLKKDYAFKTNVDLIAKYGIDEVTEIMKAAEGFANTDINYDYQNENVEELTREFYKFLPSYFEDTSFVEDNLKVGRKNKLTQIGIFITDPSLVYQCVDGQFRVRGRTILNRSNASDKFIRETDVELGKWYYYDVEYNVILDEKIEGTQYEHGKYGVYNWVRITNGWVEADANTLVLAEALLA